MEVEDIDLRKLTLSEEPASEISILWTKKTAEKAYALYRERKAKEELMKSVTPNRFSKFRSHNPLIRFEYLDPGYEGPRKNVDDNENVEANDYVCYVDSTGFYEAFREKKFALPNESVLKLDARLFQTLIYVGIPNDEKSSNERYYEYVLNLMTIPMLLPVSPFYLFMTRPEYSKLYVSSSFSICALKRLYSVRALNCETKIKTKAQLKIVNEDMLRNLEEEDVEYGKHLTSFVERYKDCVTSSDLLFSDESEMDFTNKCEIVLTEKVPVIEAICYEMVETMYFHLIRIVNIIECACINLYVHDSHADENLQHLAEIEGPNRTVNKKWVRLTTHNCLSSTENLPFSRDSVEFRRKFFFDVSNGFGYMFGKEGSKEWNAMCAVQCDYVNTMIREHMKIPGFRERYDERCNNVVYQYFSKKCYEYMSTYDDDEGNRAKGETDLTKLDVFCASSYACVQFLNVCSAKMDLDLERSRRFLYEISDIECGLRFSVDTIENENPLSVTVFGKEYLLTKELMRTMKENYSDLIWRKDILDDDFYAPVPYFEGNLVKDPEGHYRKLTKTIKNVDYIVK
jgi:hypothetical protein